MATNLQLYSNARIFVNGSELTEAADVQVSRATNSQQIVTIAKGYAGESPGAPMTEITVNNAVPAADFEMNPGKFMGEMKIVEFTVFAGNATLTFKGFIISDNFQYAANSQSQLSFTARGSFSDWS